MELTQPELVALFKSRAQAFVDNLEGAGTPDPRLLCRVIEALATPEFEITAGYAPGFEPPSRGGA